MNVTAIYNQCLTQCHILEEKIFTEELIDELWFGILVTIKGKAICTYHSVSRRRDLVEQLVSEINGGTVGLRQLEFIMDDWLINL